MDRFENDLRRKESKRDLRFASRSAYELHEADKLCALLMLFLYRLRTFSPCANMKTECHKHQKPPRSNRP